MTAHCSHDSVCVQCPADCWERSQRPCDANSRAAECQLGRRYHGYGDERRRGLFGKLSLVGRGEVTDGQSENRLHVLINKTPLEYRQCM